MKVELVKKIRVTIAATGCVDFGMFRVNGRKNPDTGLIYIVKPCLEATLVPSQTFPFDREQLVIPQLSNQFL
jgi:hypothetical protein